MEVDDINELEIDNWESISEIPVLPRTKIRKDVIQKHRIIKANGSSCETDLSLSYDPLLESVILQMSYNDEKVTHNIDKEEFTDILRKSFKSSLFIVELDEMTKHIIELRENLCKKLIMNGKPALSPNHEYNFSSGQGIIRNTSGLIIAKAIGMSITVGTGVDIAFDKIVGTKYTNVPIIMKYTIPKINLCIDFNGITLSPDNKYSGLGKFIKLSPIDKDVVIDKWPDGLNSPGICNKWDKVRSNIGVRLMRISEDKELVEFFKKIKTETGGK